METVNEDILIQYIDGTLPESSVADVEQWLAASPENEKVLEQIFFIQEVTKRIRVMNAVDPEASLQRLKARMHKTEKKTTARRTLWIMQRVAAVLFLPVLVLSVYLWMQKGQDDVRMVEVHAGQDAVSVFNLPDGSKVWLNAASTLKYPAEFVADSRQVELEGQGYFEVTHNKKKPFIVHVGQEYAVKVLGTSFNVAAYKDEDIIETTLVEGVVDIKVYRAGGQDISRILKPNEKATFTKNTKQLDVSTVNTEHETAWRDGELVFRNHSMSQVLKMLGRHYNVKFQVKDTSVLNSIITARFKDEPLSQVMEYLRLASGIKYTIPETSSAPDQTQEIPIIEISK